MLEVPRTLLLLITVLALSGCAHYRYDGRQFSDRAAAESARRDDWASIRSASAFSPRPTPLAKSVRIVVPSKVVVLERGIRTGPAEGRDYVATILYNDYRSTAELIRQRNIFETTLIEDTSDPGHVTPRPGEAVIYFYVPDSNTAAWYYLSNSTKRTPLNFDRGNPEKVGKIKYFLDSVEALAAGEPR